MARLEAVAKVGRVKPNALQARPALTRSHLKDGLAASAEKAGVADLGDYRGHFSGTQLRDASGVQPVFVAER